MVASATRVGEIERISKDIDDALSTISGAADKTRQAALDVAHAADANVAVVSTAAESITSIARAAEGHAAAAQEVSAATEEQSAACEQMEAASAELLEGSSLLRELVKGLRIEDSVVAGDVPDRVLAARQLNARREMAS
jgi:methyl-accepting chemotaxis protein